MKASSPAVSPPSLSAELRAVEGQHPGWHCWRADTGCCHATSCRCGYAGGSGTTLTAPTPQMLDHAIAEQLHQWQVAGVAA
jgi:hypothetical protein